MKHYHIILAAILIGSLATSCKIGKKYTRPELDLPTTIADTNSSDTTTVADIQWPTIYTDTVLQRLINTALTYNKDLLVRGPGERKSLRPPHGESESLPQSRSRRPRGKGI